MEHNFYFYFLGGEGGGSDYWYNFVLLIKLTFISTTKIIRKKYHKCIEKKIIIMIYIWKKVHYFVGMFTTKSSKKNCL